MSHFMRISPLRRMSKVRRVFQLAYLLFARGPWYGDMDHLVCSPSAGLNVLPLIASEPPDSHLFSLLKARKMNTIVPKEAQHSNNESHYREWGPAIVRIFEWGDVGDWHGHSTWSCCRDHSRCGPGHGPERIYGKRCVDLD